MLECWKCRGVIIHPLPCCLQVSRKRLSSLIMEQIGGASHCHSARVVAFTVAKYSTTTGSLCKPLNSLGVISSSACYCLHSCLLLHEFLMYSDSYFRYGRDAVEPATKPGDFTLVSELKTLVILHAESFTIIVA